MSPDSVEQQQQQELKSLIAERVKHQQAAIATQKTIDSKTEHLVDSAVKAVAGFRRSNRLLTKQKSDIEAVSQQLSATLEDCNQENETLQNRLDEVTQVKARIELRNRMLLVFLTSVSIVIVWGFLEPVIATDGLRFAVSIVSIALLLVLAVVIIGVRRSEDATARNASYVPVLLQNILGGVIGAAIVYLFASAFG